jgi:hypothetical protein
LKVSEVTEQLDKARREQVEIQEKFLSARCLDVQPGSRAPNRGLRSTRHTMSARSPRNVEFKGGVTGTQPTVSRSTPW